MLAKVTFSVICANLTLMVVMFIYFIAPPLYAKEKMENELIRCLAKEEEDLHSNHEIGPQYQLNQFFLNQSAEMGQSKIKPHYLKQICDNPYFPPSIAFLEMFLLEKEQLYLLPEDILERGFEKSSIESFTEKIPLIFFQFISSIQAKTAHPKCLQNHVHHIQYFINRFKYLEEEISTHALLKEKEKIKIIFQDLRNIKNIMKICKLESLPKKGPVQDKSDTSKADLKTNPRP